MSLVIHQPGPLATLQGAARRGLRHWGIPAAGAADPLALALANRLVGNAPEATAIEITLGPFRATAEAQLTVALAGAEVTVHGDGVPLGTHRTLTLARGQTLTLNPPAAGCRTYLAVSGGWAGDDWAGSSSTYLPAGLGGQSGRALQAGDQLSLANRPTPPATPLATPAELQIPAQRHWLLRAVAGPDIKDVNGAVLFGARCQVGQAADRMGFRCDLPGLTLEGHRQGSSKPLFPGAVQCADTNSLIIMLADAQTTGGYAVVANLARVDAHLAGQVRPGDTVTLHRQSPADALAGLAAKAALFSRWLPEGQWWH